MGDKVHNALASTIFLFYISGCFFVPALPDPRATALSEAPGARQVARESYVKTVQHDDGA